MATPACGQLTTYTTLIKVLPALCKGDPPVGALAFPAPV
jgi:hypothetical protein